MCTRHNLQRFRRGLPKGIATASFAHEAHTSPAVAGLILQSPSLNTCHQSFSRAPLHRSCRATRHYTGVSRGESPGMASQEAQTPLHRIQLTLRHSTSKTQQVFPNINRNTTAQSSIRIPAQHDYTGTVKDYIMI